MSGIGNRNQLLSSVLILVVTRQCTVAVLFSPEVLPCLALWTVITLVESQATLKMQYALATAWDSILKMTKEI
ncbi:hypothetical protein M405DRAFT_830058 [Rhizopogon salebrosus TDB-379]|nr:hypothetical protein M405DRAFT_830058 [Rhizopogon salebrosus TDB-379]